MSASKKSVAYLSGKRFSFTLPRSLIRALPNTDLVAKRLFHTWAVTQPILIFTKQNAAVSNVVDYRLKCLIDQQINMFLEERGRWERGMKIAGNLRGTPREWGPISGINRDIKVSIPPQLNSDFLWMLSEDTK